MREILVFMDTPFNTLSPKIAAAAAMLLVCATARTSYAAPQIKPQTAPPAGTANKTIRASEVVWQEHFGSQAAQPSTVYCLMASGFFRAPVAPNFKTLCSGWLNKHPNARVVPINSFSISVDNPQSKMAWVWVTDGDSNETLNEYLVRQGACPGGTMVLPDATAKDASGKPYPMTVSQAAYQRFVTAVAKAEKEAKQQKRGIWRKGGEAESS